MGLRRTTDDIDGEKQYDPYPIAGNMKWLRTFADSLQKEAGPARTQLDPKVDVGTNPNPEEHPKPVPQPRKLTLKEIQEKREKEKQIELAEKQKQWEQNLNENNGPKPFNVTPPKNQSTIKQEFDPKNEILYPNSENNSGTISPVPSSVFTGEGQSNDPPADGSPYVYTAPPNVDAPTNNTTSTTFTPTGVPSTTTSNPSATGSPATAPAAPTPTPTAPLEGPVNDFFQLNYQLNKSITEFEKSDPYKIIQNYERTKFVLDGFLTPYTKFKQYYDAFFKGANNIYEKIYQPNHGAFTPKTAGIKDRISDWTNKASDKLSKNKAGDRINWLETKKVKEDRDQHELQSNPKFTQQLVDVMNKAKEGLSPIMKQVEDTMDALLKTAVDPSVKKQYIAELQKIHPLISQMKNALSSMAISAQPATTPAEQNATTTPPTTNPAATPPVTTGPGAEVKTPPAAGTSPSSTTGTTSGGGGGGEVGGTSGKKTRTKGTGGRGGDEETIDISGDAEPLAPEEQFLEDDTPEKIVEKINKRAQDLKAKIKSLLPGMVTTKLDTEIDKILVTLQKELTTHKEPAPEQEIDIEGTKKKWIDWKVEYDWDEKTGKPIKRTVPTNTSTSVQPSGTPMTKPYSGASPIDVNANKNKWLKTGVK